MQLILFFVVLVIAAPLILYAAPVILYLVPFILVGLGLSLMADIIRHRSMTRRH